MCVCVLFPPPFLMLKFLWPFFKTFFSEMVNSSNCSFVNGGQVHGQKKSYLGLSTLGGWVGG